MPSENLIPFPIPATRLQEVAAMPTLNWIGKDAVIRHHKEVLDIMPPHDVPKVIYAATVKGLGPAVLQRTGIVFKHTQYAIEV